MESLAASEGTTDCDGSPEIHSILTANSRQFAQLFIKIRFPQPRQPLVESQNRWRGAVFSLKTNTIVGLANLGLVD